MPARSRAARVDRRATATRAARTSTRWSTGSSAFPFAETRSYVQRVMENYEVYKMRLSGTFDIAGDLVNGRKEDHR